MQELIGYYIPMEEYYMRESVNKVLHVVLLVATYVRTVLNDNHSVTSHSA